MHRSRRSLLTESTLLCPLFAMDKTNTESHLHIESLHRVKRSFENSSFSSSTEEVVHRVENPSEEVVTYTDTDLQPYTKYGYKIRASNSAG